MFVTTGVASLFLGSAMLDEELKSEEDKELAYRIRTHSCAAGGILVPVGHDPRGV